MGCLRHTPAGPCGSAGFSSRRTLRVSWLINHHTIINHHSSPGMGDESAFPLHRCQAWSGDHAPSFCGLESSQQPQDGLLVLSWGNSRVVQGEIPNPGVAMEKPHPCSTTTLSHFSPDPQLALSERRSGHQGSHGKKLSQEDGVYSTQTSESSAGMLF